MQDRGKQTLHLMCKTHHIAFYQMFGYAYIAPSASDHGGMAWHDMRMAL